MPVAFFDQQPRNGLRQGGIRQFRGLTQSLGRRMQQPVRQGSSQPYRQYRARRRLQAFRRQRDGRDAWRATGPGQPEPGRLAEVAGGRDHRHGVRRRPAPPPPSCTAIDCQGQPLAGGQRFVARPDVSANLTQFMQVRCHSCGTAAIRACAFRLVQRILPLRRTIPQNFGCQINVCRRAP